MKNSHTPFVPTWVRSIVCVVACLSVPGLILAAYLGAGLNYWLVLTVGLFAGRIVPYAFKLEKSE